MNGIGAFDKMKKELQGVSELIVVHGDTLSVFTDVKSHIREQAPCADVAYLKIPPGDPCVRDVSAMALELAGRRPFLLAIGGGRVIDFTKALAAQAGNHLSGNDIFSADPLSWNNTLRLAAIATRPGSGSEYNNAFILSDEQGWKRSLFSLSTYPEFCIHDPRFFSALDREQYLYGVFDAVMHVFDQYIVDRPESLVVDELSLAYLKILGQLARSGLEEGRLDFQQLAWASSLVSSGVLTRGVSASWRCHELAHALASRVRLDHGRSLAFVADAVFAKHCASTARYDRAINAVSAGLGGAQLERIQDFIGRLFGAAGVELSIAPSALADELWEQCPNFTRDLIEDILWAAINEK
jgi:alcohol dehydrogenase YqhD (iron-dependent ADH family)